jgi:SAM-dependent methyltransferase
MDLVREIDPCNLCGAPIDRRRDLRWEKDGLDIVRCPSCGTLIRADPPSYDALEEIYGPAYFSDAAGTTRGQGYADYLGEEANHRANAVTRVRLLGRYQPPGRLLDVGCAAGFFLDEARRGGWQVQGVEFSTEMASYARTRLALDVLGGSFEHVDLGSETFDAVTMWDYLEHSIDPAGDLGRCGKLLRKGGILAISTGDAASFTARLSRHRWHLLTPRHHNFFFTRASLEEALRRAEFEIVFVKYRASRYSLGYLTHKLRTLTDWSPFTGLARVIGRSRLGRVSVPVNLYDIMTVVARRI